MLRCTIYYIICVFYYIYSYKYKVIYNIREEVEEIKVEEEVEEISNRACNTSRRAYEIFNKWRLRLVTDGQLVATLIAVRNDRFLSPRLSCPSRRYILNVPLCNNYQYYLVAIFKYILLIVIGNVTR